MVIGILVFNKLVSRDGILDKKLKHRAGYDSTSLLVPHFSSKHFLTSCKNTNVFFFFLTHMEIQTSFSCCWKEITGINIKRSDLSRERHGFVFLWQNQSKMKIIKSAHTLAASAVANMAGERIKKVGVVAVSVCLSCCCLYVPQTDEWAAYRINSQVCQMWCCINNCFISNYS